MTHTLRQQHDSIRSASTRDAPGTNLCLPPAWTEQALCAQVDPELWFPDKGGSTREAKAICRRCPVQDACLDYALTHHEGYGIWGGVSERARRQLLDQIPTDDTPDDTWFADGDDFTYDTDLGEIA